MSKTYDLIELVIEQIRDEIVAKGQKQNKPLLSQAPYRGRVQAQGDDIEKDGGYSCSWAQNVPVTDREGLSFLAKIEEQCTKSQQEQRKRAFAKAKRFVKQASEQGGVSPEAQPRSFQDSNRTVSNARVDIEIWSGITFIPCPLEKPE